MNPPTLDKDILLAALDGLIAKKAEIENQIRQVREILGPDAPADGKPKRNFSPEAKERIARAQRKRWAKYRKEAQK
jgi:hypothetical protein